MFCLKDNGMLSSRPFCLKDNEMFSSRLFFVSRAVDCLAFDHVLFEGIWDV